MEIKRIYKTHERKQQNEENQTWKRKDKLNKKTNKNKTIKNYKKNENK